MASNDGMKVTVYYTKFVETKKGDFNKKDLKEALEFMKDYAPTSDSSSFYENRWHRLLKSKLKGEKNETRKTFK